MMIEYCQLCGTNISLSSDVLLLITLVTVELPDIAHDHIYEYIDLAVIL